MVSLTRLFYFFLGFRELLQILSTGCLVQVNQTQFLLLVNKDPAAFRLNTRKYIRGNLAHLFIIMGQNEVFMISER